MAVPRTALLAVPVASGSSSAGLRCGRLRFRCARTWVRWRQPLAVLANGAIVIGLVPAVLAIGDGSWHTPRTPMPRLRDPRPDLAVGDFRVLYVGDPRVLLVPARRVPPGHGYAVTDAGSLDFSVGSTCRRRRPTMPSNAPSS